MAIALVQEVGSTSSSAGTSLACTWTGATTAGNLLVMGISIAANSLSVSLTPPSGWTLIDTAVTANNGANPITTTALYYKKNAASESGSKTFTFSQSVNASMFLSEWSGADPSSPLDVTASNTQTSTTTLTSGTTASTSQSAEVAIALISINSNFTLSTPTNGFTLQDNQKSGSAGTARISGAFLYKILAASAAQSTGVTSSGTNPAASKIATFKAASGGALVQLTSTGSVGAPKQFPLGPPDMSGATTLTDTTPNAVWTPTHPGDPPNTGLRSGTDYIINCPATRTRLLKIVGGRNVYIPKLIHKFATATALSLAPDGEMLYMQGGDASGIIHIDTCWLNNNRLQCDALKTFKVGNTTTNSNGTFSRTVQVRNCYIEKLVGQKSQVHADLWQTSGGCGDIWIEDFTGSTEYDGFMFQQEANIEQQNVAFTVSGATNPGGGANYVYTTTTPHGYSVGDPVVVWNMSPNAYNGGYTILSTTSTTFTCERGDSTPGSSTAGGNCAKMFFGYLVNSINLNRVNVKGFTNEITALASNQAIRFGARTTPSANAGNPGATIGSPPMPANTHINEDQTPLNSDQWAGTLTATNWYGEPDSGDVGGWVEPDKSTSNYSGIRPVFHAAAGGSPAYCDWPNQTNVTPGTKFQQGPPPGGDYVSIQGGVPVARLGGTGGSGVAVKIATADAAMSVVQAGSFSNAYDTFERTVGAGGLGTADLGGTYTLTGTAADFSVTGHAAVIALTAAPQSKIAVLSNIASTTQYVSATMQTDTFPAGSYTAFDLYLRYVNSNNWYRCRVALTTGGLVQIRWDMNLAGVNTTLKAFVSTAFTALAAEDYTIIAQAVGTSPTVLNAYVYDAINPAPSPLPSQVSASDSSAALQVSSAAGMGCALNTGSTATSTHVSIGRWDVWPTRLTSTNNAVHVATTPDAIMNVPVFTAGTTGSKHRYIPRS